MELMHQRLRMLYIITVNFNLAMLYVHYFAHVVFQSQLKFISFYDCQVQKVQ